MRLCRGWMTCIRARNDPDLHPGFRCSHASLHKGSDVCFTPCSNGDKTICMEVDVDVYYPYKYLEVKDEDL